MAQEAIELQKGDSRLREEITSLETLSAYPTWVQWALSDLNPTDVWRAMLSPDGGAAIKHYDDMEEKDGHYSSQLETRKEAVLSKTWRVNPAPTSAAAGSRGKAKDPVAEFVEDTLWSIRNFEHVLREMLDCIGKGVSVQEIVYALDGPRLVIERIEARPQSLFAFSEVGKPPVGPLRLAPGAFSQFEAAAGLASAADGLSGPVLPSNKFVVCTFQMSKGNRWGRPLGRRCYWYTWFKRQDIKFWLKFIEKGSGTVVTKYRDGAGDEERAKALEAAKAINRTTAVAISERFVAELLEKARAGSGAGEVFEKLATNLCNTEMSLVILGQTLSTRGGDSGSGSMALGEVHERTQNFKTESDAKMLMECVQQQVVNPIVRLNFGPDVEAPEFIIEYEEGEDLDKRVQRDKTLSTMVDVPQSYIRTTYQLPEPEGGEPIVEVRPGVDAGAGGAGLDRPASRRPGGSSSDPNADRESPNGDRRGGATNLAERGSEDEPTGDPGDPEPQVIEREALERGRGLYAQFVGDLIERASEEIR